MVRIGLIGCGNVTLNVHVPAIRETSGLEVVAAADPTPARLEAVRVAAGLDVWRCFADWRDLVALAEVDAVLVATPQRFRPEIAIAAASAGKHLICEKPIALTPAVAHAVVRAAQDNRVKLATVHNYVYMPVNQMIKDVVTDGRIGKLEVATLNFLGVEDRPGAEAYSPRWRHFTAEAGGGVLMDMLHAVYLGGWLFDEEPISVSATVNKRFADEGDVEDLALVRYRFPSGGHALINMAWGVGPGGIELAGSAGRAIVTTAGHATYPFVPAERIAVYGPGGEEELRPAEPVLHGVAGVWSDFHDAVRDDRSPSAPGEAAVTVLGAVIGAYASAALEREIPLPLLPGDPFFEHGAQAVRELDLRPSHPVRQHGLFGYPKPS